MNTTDSTQQTITSEELNKIQDLKSTGEKFIIEFGSLELEMLVLNQRKKDLEDKFMKFKNEEKNFMGMMDYKYGNVNLDIETGILTPRN